MIKSIISFKQIPFVVLGKAKVVSEYKIPVKDVNGKDVFVKIEPDEGENRYETVIETELSKNIARNQFKIDKEMSKIQNGCMDVWKDVNKRKGLGVVMHLNSIMVLFENNLEKIELQSLADAVVFHSKCKFEPNITDKDSLLDALYKITTKDSAKYPELEAVSKAAGDIFDEIHGKGELNFSFNKDRKRANDVINEYLEVINKKKLSSDEKEQLGFDAGFSMVLTKEKILENKDFFNKLFKDFKIDYEIKS